MCCPDQWCCRNIDFFFVVCWPNQAGLWILTHRRGVVWLQADTAGQLAQQRTQHAARLHKLSQLCAPGWRAMSGEVQTRGQLSTSAQVRQDGRHISRAGWPPEQPLIPSPSTTASPTHPPT